MREQIFIYILFLNLGCNFGNRGVYYKEMRSPPKLLLNKNTLIVTTENSKFHDALLIYKIDELIIPKDHLINLSAFEAAMKPFKTEFRIELNEDVANEIRLYKIYWLDPDGNKTELQIEYKS